LNVYPERNLISVNLKARYGKWKRKTKLEMKITFNITFTFMYSICTQVNDESFHNLEEMNDEEEEIYEENVLEEDFVGEEKDEVKNDEPENAWETFLVEISLLGNV